MPSPFLHAFLSGLLPGRRFRLRARRPAALFGTAIFALLLSACASTSQTANNEQDPWESVNRKVFSFNETADKYLAKPVAEAYDRVTPEFLQQGFGNMFDNLGDVGNLFHDLLQAKFSAAATDGGRFFINTTVGVMGFFDVAGHIGLHRRSEDFGQVLGYWGVGPGPYMILPVLGPSTLRDTAGLPVDSLPDLVNQASHIRTRNQLRALRLVDKRAGLLGKEDLISGDKYTFIRDAFLQRREFLISDGEVVDDAFGDEDFDAWE